MTITGYAFLIVMYLTLIHGMGPQGAAIVLADLSGGQRQPVHLTKAEGGIQFKDEEQSGVRSHLGIRVT
ncbi:MAG: hypothetical protein FD176_2624 [Rhodospirillaceae bacterium]|nr:MAG: hypothetical protein FD176_2624 [Rhodospirillaceae bacterium]